MTLRPSATWRDALLAVAAAGAACLVLLRTDVHAVDPALRDPDLFAAAVTAGAGLSGCWWRTHPARWFAATTLAAVVVAAAGHYVGLLPWLVTAALCAVAARHPRRRSLTALAVAVAGYTAISVAGIPDNAGDAFLSTVALLVAAWALGDGVRLRRGRVAAELHAARSDAAAARQEAARATTEERLRIARELHDVVAHSMSLIAVHAGVGAHLIRHQTRPGRAHPRGDRRHQPGGARPDPVPARPAARPRKRQTATTARAGRRCRCPGPAASPGSSTPCAPAGSTSHCTSTASRRSTRPRWGWPHTGSCRNR